MTDTNKKGLIHIFTQYFCQFCDMRKETDILYNIYWSFRVQKKIVSKIFQLFLYVSQLCVKSVRCQSLLCQLCNYHNELNNMSYNDVYISIVLCQIMSQVSTFECQQLIIINMLHVNHLLMSTIC